MTGNELTKFSGRCLCGLVRFECGAEPEFQACCHCDDCRHAGGGVYGSFVFVSGEALQITGEMRSYEHESDRGNTIDKAFLPDVWVSYVRIKQQDTRALCGMGRSHR